MPDPRGRARIILYAATIFLSAFLLFLIQPIFAKLILPWFGGSSAVWSTCLVFFQTVLLAGYLYAHLLTKHWSVRWTARRQPWVHILLLVAALALLPVMPGERWKPTGTGDPAWQILAMLTIVLGLPYFLLSATSPLLQKWLSRDGSQPYRLFALSNFGALLALAIYPVFIEPKMTTRAQDLSWSAGFLIFAVLCGASAVMSAPHADVWLEWETSSKARMDIRWLLLPAAGSMLLVSTTNQLTQNVAAVPFLWILPLGAYLLSFIISFESPRWYHRGLFLRLLAVTLGSLAYILYDVQVSVPIWIAIPLFTAGLFIACMFCHGELARLRPETSELTWFYSMIGLGGALGAILCGLIAPRVFNGIHELPISLVVVAALALWLNWKEGWTPRLLWLTVAAAMVVALIAEIHSFRKGAIAMTRSFYGSLRVVDSTRGGLRIRSIYHGTIQHGAQFLDEAKRREPTLYFSPESGAGIVLRFFSQEPKSVGIIGLGAGTLAAYGKPGDTFEFYEINPQVIELARTYFTFLSDSRAKIKILTGDARLSMENEPPSQLYDVFLADAFSGDAIPVHLLTSEAFDLYLKHLKPRGILAVHVSNSYLDLAPVVARLASAHGLTARSVHTEPDEAHLVARSDWILMSRDAEFFNRPEIAASSKQVEEKPKLRLWTDDYNNLLEVLKF